MRQPDLMTFALRGAELRLREMDREKAEIFATFPGLARRERTPLSNPEPAETADDRPLRRKRKPMTTAQRKNISRRMKAYWRGQR